MYAMGPVACTCKACTCNPWNTSDCCAQTSCQKSSLCCLCATMLLHVHELPWIMLDMLFFCGAHIVLLLLCATSNDMTSFATTLLVLCGFRACSAFVWQDTPVVSVCSEHNNIGGVWVQACPQPGCSLRSSTAAGARQDRLNEHTAPCSTPTPTSCLTPTSPPTCTWSPTST